MSFTTENYSDNYVTDKKGWEIIKPYIPTDKKIWSPFYCDGTQKDIFNDMGFDIIHQDNDFFSYTPEYDIVIDNPPFSKKRDICIKLKELDKPFILILPSVMLSCKWFLDLFKDQLQILVPYNRTKFKHLNNENKNYTPPYACFYFTYKMNMENDIIYI